MVIISNQHLCMVSQLHPLLLLFAPLCKVCVSVTAPLWCHMGLQYTSALLLSSFSVPSSWWLETQTIATPSSSEGCSGVCCLMSPDHVTSLHSRCCSHHPPNLHSLPVLLRPPEAGARGSYLPSPQAPQHRWVSLCVWFLHRRNRSFPFFPSTSKESPELAVHHQIICQITASWVAIVFLKCRYRSARPAGGSAGCVDVVDVAPVAGKRSVSEPDGCCERWQKVISLLVTVWQQLGAPAHQTGQTSGRRTRRCKINMGGLVSSPLSGFHRCCSFVLCRVEPFGCSVLENEWMNEWRTTPSLTKGGHRNSEILIQYQKMNNFSVLNSNIFKEVNLVAASQKSKVAADWL